MSNVFFLISHFNPKTYSIIKELNSCFDVNGVGQTETIQRIMHEFILFPIAPDVVVHIEHTLINILICLSLY